MANKPRILSVFSLVMINIIAVDSLRSLAVGAEYGYGLIFFYTIALFAFLLPIAFVSAELATAWPHTGGIYVWTREAFGKPWALLTIWLQWIYNVVWYPTLLAFLAATVFYLWDPQLATHKLLMFFTIVTLFWTATFLNCFGMRVSSWISTLGTLIGTLLPMALIIGLSIQWLWSGHSSQNTSHTHWLPSLSSLHDLSFFTVILFGLIGLEMSAVHAEEVQNPSKDYPRALLISTVVIYFTLMCASLAIVLVIPHHHLNLVTGLMDAFHIFFTTFHLEKFTALMACFIILGGFSSMSAWIIGPTKGLLVAAEDGLLPLSLQKTNRYGVPVRILMLQGFIVTVLSFIFLVMPTVNSSYWILSALTAQLAMVVYLLMFAAAIRLRYHKNHIPRPYAIPGQWKHWGMWFWAGLGFFTCIFAIIVGFLPPKNINLGSTAFFESFLIVGLMVCCLLPFLIKERPPTE